jgi:hypothetical protein
MSRNPNDVNAYRKEKKRKAVFLKLIITAIVLIAVFYVWAFRETIFSPLQGIANRVGSGINEGFPVVLSGSAGYSMNRVDTNFLLLSDTYLYTYNYRGGQVISHRHNYARPMQKTTDRRTLIYNFNGHEFMLFSRNSLIYEQRLDDRIVLAELGGSDMAAIVTTSAAFSNILHIYDGQGNWRYRQRFIDEEVMAVEFASQNNEIFVATSTVRNGEIFCKLYRFRTDTEDDLIWEQYLPHGSWALQINENGNYVSVLADNMIMTFSADDGEFVGSYSFDSGRLVRDIYGDEFNLIILSDYVTGRTLYVTLDPQSQLIKAEIMPFEAKQVEIFGEIVYTLTGAGLIQHDKDLNQVGLIGLDDEFRDFVIVNQYAMLLGYGTIERVEIIQ